MGLVSALVDRARVVRRESTGQKIEGTTQMSPTHGTWFKCRLFMEESRERDEQGERKKVVVTPRLMYGVRDEDRNPIDVKNTDELEITSNVGGGDATWRIMGDPQPIPRRRGVIGYLVTLERVLEPKREGVS